MNIFLLYPTVLFLSLFHTNLVFSQEPIKEYKIPDFFIAESTAKIEGSFDGNSENTLIFFEKGEFLFEASIISESKTEVTINTPVEKGNYNLIIDEATTDALVQFPVHVFLLQLDIGKTSLQRGEQSELRIRIDGVQEYTKPILLTVSNKSPQTISLPNSNFETYTLVNNSVEPFLTKEIIVSGIKTGPFNLVVEAEPENNLVTYDWEQLRRKWVKEFEGSETNVKQTVSTDEKVESSPTTKSSVTKSGYDNPDNPSDSTVCTCTIKKNTSHGLSNTTYTITKAMEDKALAEAFRKKGIQFPKKDSNNFSGHNIPIVPGSAYATGFGDVVGAYSNAVANSWGKKPANGSFAPNNFETEDIAAKSSAFGRHEITISPGKNEWSLVIGVAAVKSSTQANAIDQLEFERELMKEFGRGEAATRSVFGIIGTLTNPIGSLIEDVVGAVYDVTGVTKWRKKKATTNSNASAFAETLYLVKVNNSKGMINKSSRAYRRAKIVRPTTKKTKIEVQKSSKESERKKEGNIIVSGQHPTKVVSTINAGAKVRCGALGNGIAESGVDSKTAVCIVGFCVSNDGALKMEYIYDSGVFALDKKGKEVADNKTNKLDKEVDDFFVKLEKQLNGKTASEMRNTIKNDVKNNLQKLFEEWW